MVQLGIVLLQPLPQLLQIVAVPNLRSLTTSDRFVAVAVARAPSVRTVAMPAIARVGSKRPQNPAELYDLLLLFKQIFQPSKYRILNTVTNT